MNADTLPADIESERATLGAVLLNRDALTAIVPFLTSSHFYEVRHGQIYAAMLRCYARKVPPDTRMVYIELENAGQMEGIGGIAYLSSLTDSVPTSYHVEYYARAVLDKARLRGLVAAGVAITRIGYTSTDPAEAEAEAQTHLTRAVQQGADDDMVPIGVVASAEYERLNRGEMPGLPTGFRDLDELLGGGLGRGDMITLAARPSVGKTSMALCIADNMVRNVGPVGFFSLEMKREQLLWRLAAMRTTVDVQSIRSTRLRPEELAAVLDAYGEVAELPLIVCERGELDGLGLRARVMRQMSRHPDTCLIVIDYLQLMQGKGNAENRVQEVSALSRGVKSLAKDAGVPILCLSQLSRAVEGRTSHVPMLSDLRESGAIEQDSDIVMFIYREELYEPTTDKKGIAEIHIAKHRNGPVGVVPMRFDGSTTRFDDLSYRGMSGY